MGPENLTPTLVRTPDRPARNKSLYRLHYSGQQLLLLEGLKYEDKSLDTQAEFLARILDAAARINKCGAQLA
jgi:hypothetical protein